ncbi:MAG: SPFH domain-containing protein [Bacteroidota bacterium]
MINKMLYFSLLLGSLLFFAACQKQTVVSPDTTNSSTYDEYSYDQVYQQQIGGIRLGDGVPLSLDLSIRWKVSDCDLFVHQFNSANDYSQLILLPRTLELANNISSSYVSVDSVFTAQRQSFIADIKTALLKQLGEEGILIKEVIVANINFPSSYTKAMEEVGLQRQELERIQQREIADLAKAKADRKRAEAKGKVDIAKAEAAGKLQRIQAETEKSRRASELAKAETQNQVNQMNAKAEADRRRLMAKADLDNQRALKNLEIQKTRELDDLAVEKQRKLEENKLQREIRFAQLCTENPTFASYLVNKELASKVQIAVLPSDSDPSVFKGILGNAMPSMKKDTEEFIPQ